MTSVADIYNLALGILRVSQTVSDAAERSVTARVCTQFYDQSRKETLRAFPWGCALRAQALAEVADQTFPGWSYVYQYPTNCLMVRHVTDEGGIRLTSSLLSSNDLSGFGQISHRQPWQVALKDDNASTVLLSDIASAWVLYTVDVDNPGIFSPDLVTTIARKLAAYAGASLQADSARIDYAEQSYYMALSQASAQSFNESRDDPRPESPSISCRA